MTDTFFEPQMNFLPKNNLYKVDTGTKTIFTSKDIYFRWKIFYPLVYILNNFSHSVFYPLNCFGWSKKFKIYRSLGP